MSDKTSWCLINQLRWKAYRQCFPCAEMKRKGKRMRFYSVKPIDKILPRQTISAFGKNSVHISTHPAFFRAPMLTSKIHTQWDPEFCKSTEYQLGKSSMEWSDLWLTRNEQEVITHRQATGEWLTIAKLSESKSDHD